MKGVDRRYFLSSLGGFPLLPGLLSAQALRGGREPRSLILLWMDGGMSHLDTLDCKPEAPVGIRGDLRIVESSLEEVFVSEHLPRLGAMMKNCSLIRSLTSPEGNHDRGSHFMLTGHRPSPVLTYPSAGSVLGRMRTLANENPIPPYIAIPDAHQYARQGFLPVSHAPFELDGDPSKPDFQVRHLKPVDGMQRALKLLEKVDQLDGGPRSESEAARDQFLAQARHLSLSPEVRALFDLEHEKPELRERYGRHFFGQACLMARRLVEGGVGTVMVRYQGWDHHQGIGRSLTQGFPPKLPALDTAISALHDDLERRGMLENTLVVLASEFGRTPRLNPAGGRDHWSRASSVLLFGAGVKRGAVAGKTDARGEEPAELPVTPRDLYATILHALGADTNAILKTPDGRPVRVVEEEAKLVKQILG
jgi:hypothetical protein